jgi:cysteine desulfurase
MPQHFIKKEENAKKAIDNAREIIASKINALPREIIFTSGGTESDNLAIKGIAYANKDKGNHIITSKIEHPAIYNSFKTLEKEGFETSYISVDDKGFLNLEELKNSITDKTILVSVIHANNEIGTIQNLKKISEICKEKGVLFHTDAVQSFTKTEIDVNEMGIDLASFSSHKIHGPKGIGALYIRAGTKINKITRWRFS